MESQERTQNKQSKSVVDQSISYAQQLKASRAKSEKASTEKKKLQYSYKKISSQIVRSKNSVSARKAVQSAKREVMRLKRLRANGQYDEDELNVAIEHAKSMEKIARKKVTHLEQEEMVERHDKGISGAIEELEEKREESGDEEEISEEEIPEELEDAEIGEEAMADVREFQYETELRMAELSEALSDKMEQVAEASSDSMSELMEEMSREMMEMMEDMDLSELMESTVAPSPNMSDEDLKMLKIKHRAKEMKEIAEADKIYLKDTMEHEKNKAASRTGMPGAGSAGPAGISFSVDTPKIAPSVSMPGGGASAPTVSGGFDVSV